MMAYACRLVVLLCATQALVVLGKEFGGAEHQRIAKRSLGNIADMFNMNIFRPGSAGAVDTAILSTQSPPAGEHPLHGSESEHHLAKRTVDLSFVNEIVHWPHRKIEEALRVLPGGKYLVHDHYSMDSSKNQKIITIAKSPNGESSHSLTIVKSFGAPVSIIQKVDAPPTTSDLAVPTTVVPALVEAAPAAIVTGVPVVPVTEVPVVPVTEVPVVSSTPEAPTGPPPAALPAAVAGIPVVPVSELPVTPVAEVPLQPTVNPVAGAVIGQAVPQPMNA